jgi:hypothetical protein
LASFFAGPALGDLLKGYQAKLATGRSQRREDRADHREALAAGQGL